jgi:hypothetical protein
MYKMNLEMLADGSPVMVTVFLVSIRERWHFGLIRSRELEKLLTSSSLNFGSSGRIRRFLPLVSARPKRVLPG